MNDGESYRTDAFVPSMDGTPDGLDGLDHAQNSKWDGADFTNAVVDRVSFDGSSMKVCCARGHARSRRGGEGEFLGEKLAPQTFRSRCR